MAFGTAAACDISMNTALSAEQRKVYQDVAVIREILGSARTIAMVGLSSEKTKASNMVASYLVDEGYRVIPITPKPAVIYGEQSYPDLKSVPFPIDVVSVFRPAHEAPAIVDAAIEVGAKAVWMQLRIIDLASADRAIAAGLNVVVDRCIKMEHGRYGGNLHWAGMNTEVLSARRPARR